VLGLALVLALGLVLALALELALVLALVRQVSGTPHFPNLPFWWCNISKLVNPFIRCFISKYVYN
jgi:hypothetical protein